MTPALNVAEGGRLNGTVDASDTDRTRRDRLNDLLDRCLIDSSLVGRLVLLIPADIIMIIIMIMIIMPFLYMIALLRRTCSKGHSSLKK